MRVLKNRNVVAAGALWALGTVAAVGQQPADPATAAPSAATVQQAAAQGISITQGGTIHGVVTSGNTPLPGVAVTATNTLTGKKFAAATDIDGNYAMSIPKNGRYVIRAELTGFAATTAEVVLTGDLQASAAKATDFGMELASRAEAAEAKASATTTATALSRGLQGLSLSGTTDANTSQASAGNGNTGVEMPTLANLNDSVTGDAASAGGDSIAVSGQSGQMNGMANFSEDEIHQRIQEAVERAKANGMVPEGFDPTNAIVGMLGGMMNGGGPGGGGLRGRGGRGGGGSRGGGSGAFRGFNPAQPHGSLNYSGEFSQLDAQSWSPTVFFQPPARQDYLKNGFGATLAGSPYIPGLTKPDTRQFVFINFSGKRDTNPEILNAVVPTDAERSGDFRQLGVNIYDPAAPGTIFNYAGNNNVIDPARIDPVAQRILDLYYPHCNVGCNNPSSNTRYNFQTPTTAGSNSASVSARYTRTIGQNAATPFPTRRSSSGPPQLRQNISSNFSYSHAASDNRSVFLALGGAQISDGYNFGVGYTVGYGRFNNSTNLNWNRSHAQTRNYFTDTQDDPTRNVGLVRPSDQAIGIRPNFYNGLSNITLTQFTGLNNTAPSETIGQTISLSDSMSWRRHKHNMRWGFDFRRVHQDSLGGSNPLGTLVFTGVFTARNTADTTTNASGSSFADFLLGLPQQSKIQAGMSKIYLRENVFDAYAQDDFRVTDNISINAGVRYEYFSPFSEINNHLVNLTGVSTYTPNVGCVTPTGGSFTTTNGTITCSAGPTGSLLHPDRSMISPRFGVAWKPKWVKQTVVRAGYGINYNTGQFATFARLLSYQPPYALVQNNVSGADCSAATGFKLSNPVKGPFGCSSKLFQNSFGVNPNYRLGMVQVYNVDIQRTLPWGVVANIGYNGSHGINLDVVRAPNSAFDRVTTANAVAFTYEDSTAASTFNALTLSAQKRLQHGVSMGAQYQWAHSIDNASSIGGSTSTSSIQNDADLHAERGNSSFDVRHKLTGNWLYELPVGPNRLFLNKGGFWAAALDGFNLSGSFTFASGSYFTPSFSATAAQIAAGGTYTLRPDRVPGVSVQGAGQATTPANPRATYFNTAAFAAHVGGYGNASRYSIEGPGQVSINAALSRTIQLGDTRSLEARMSATNVFNTVQYSGINTSITSATYGQVTSGAAMRKIVFSARYRF